MEHKQKIIILNGCGSAGKSTIVKHMQQLSEKPLLTTGVDHIWSMVPEQYTMYGAKADEKFHLTANQSL